MGPSNAIEGYLLRYGLPLVFANVLVEQIGLPIPAVPTLLVVGALAAEHHFPGSQALLVAVLASLLADCSWYAVGRRTGMRVLKTLCKISLSPDSCVRQSTTTFERFGMRSLLVTKFVPGLSLLGAPLAGAVGGSFVAFVAYEATGAVVWAGTSLLVGALFHRAIDSALHVLTSLGSSAAAFVALALLGFVGVKWWRRRGLYETLRMARISVDELKRLIDAGERPVVLDVRSATARRADPKRIPGARVFLLEEIEARAGELPRDRDIVVYCNCPNDVSAAIVAKALMDRGFARVRPLAGGLEAWELRGHAVEAEAPPVA